MELLCVGTCRHPEWVTLRRGRLGAVEFPAICALISHPSAGAILFDTGYARHFWAATRSWPERLYRWTTPVRLAAGEELTRQLRDRGVDPSAVRMVILSHLHADHVAGLRDLPGARVLALGAEVDARSHVSGLAGVRRGFLPALLPPDFQARVERAEAAAAVALGPAWAPFEHGLDLLGDGSLLGIPMPGHSPGQLGLALRDRRHGDVLLAADAAWSSRALREGRPPSRLAGLVMSDWAQYRATLASLQRLAAARPDLTIVPSHCAEALRTWRATASGGGGEGASRGDG